MTTTQAFLVDSNSTPLSNVGISIDTSGVPTVQTKDSGGNPVSTPVGGSGSTPASSISPKAAGTGAVGTAAAYARQDHTHPVNDGVDIGLINSTQKTQIAGGATTALLNATKTALKDPAGGADVTLGVSAFSGLSDRVTADIVGTNTGVSAALANKFPIPTAWAASVGGGTPTLSSGTAVLGAAFRNTTAGTTTFTTPIDGIPFVAKDDELVCLVAGTYTYLPAGTGYPIAISGATTLADAHNTTNLICSGTPALTLNTGRVFGFGCSIDGAFTLSGGLTIGSGVTDLRASTGTAFCSLVQSDTSGAGATYKLVGTK
jgi:hypothetical protein